MCLRDNIMEEVKAEDICKLLDHFSKYSYRASERDSQTEEIENCCLRLFAADYNFTVIGNAGGELCSHYPSQLIVLEYEKNKDRDVFGKEEAHYQSIYDITKLREQFIKARFARCRARFPLPVILYEGKHICRSSTLSGGPEIYGRSGFDLFFTGGESIPDEDEEDEITLPQTSSEWQLFDRVRSQDIRLLRTFNIGYICDLMVEKKKVKFGMNVTSSEKVDKENRYSDFTIISLPYPGCEFFRIYKDSGYGAEGLMFDWNQSHVDANIVVPKDPVTTQLGIDWSSYKSWDLIRLTQNYFKLIISYIMEANNGMLIHCISGWDRTPLFVSLLRLSLWADGKIHQSLGAYEIIYLTIAYDWFLFGHNLVDRLGKGEEILFFCFYFLKYIVSEEFSVSKKKCACSHLSRNESSNHADCTLFESDSSYGVRGSNTSLSSNCSSLSNRSQDNPPVFFTTLGLDSSDEMNQSTNGNSSQWHNSHIPWSSISRDNPVMIPSISRTTTSTTPVAVPGIVRHRSDSGSSVGCGSWQLISGTGSLRGSASAHETNHTPSSDASSQSRHSQSSLCCDILEEENSSSTATLVPATRKERLHLLRSAFYSFYRATIGFQFHNGGEQSGLSSLFDHFAEKVGIRSTRTVNA